MYDLSVEMDSPSVLSPGWTQATMYVFVLPPKESRSRKDSVESR